MNFRLKAEATNTADTGPWLPALAGKNCRLPGSSHEPGRQGWHLRIFGGKIPHEPCRNRRNYVWAYRANHLATRISNPSVYLPTRGFSSISPHTAKRWTRCSRGSTVGKASWSSQVRWAPASRHCAPPSARFEPDDLFRVRARRVQFAGRAVEDITRRVRHHLGRQPSQRPLARCQPNAAPLCAR